MQTYVTPIPLAWTAIVIPLPPSVNRPTRLQTLLPTCLVPIRFPALLLLVIRSVGLIRQAIVPTLSEARPRSQRTLSVVALVIYSVVNQPFQVQPSVVVILSHLDQPVIRTVVTRLLVHRNLIRSRQRTPVRQSTPSGPNPPQTITPWTITRTTRLATVLAGQPSVLPALHLAAVVSATVILTQAATILSGTSSSF